MSGTLTWLLHVVVVLSELGDQEEREVVPHIRSTRAVPLEVLFSTVNAVPQVFPCSSWAASVENTKSCSSTASTVVLRKLDQFLVVPER
jgi:hypothetical protein